MATKKRTTTATAQRKRKSDSADERPRPRALQATTKTPLKTPRATKAARKPFKTKAQPAKPAKVSAHTKQIVGKGKPSGDALSLSKSRAKSGSIPTPRKSAKPQGSAPARAAAASVTAKTARAPARGVAAAREMAQTQARNAQKSQSAKRNAGARSGKPTAKKTEQRNAPGNARGRGDAQRNAQRNARNARAREARRAEREREEARRQRRNERRRARRLEQRLREADPRRADEALAFDWLKRIRDDIANVFETSLTITSPSGGIANLVSDQGLEAALRASRTPWFIVGRYDPEEEITYQTLARGLRVVEDDLLLETAINPDRLSQIRIVFAETPAPGAVRRTEGDAVVSRIGAWAFALSDIITELVGADIDNPSEDSLAWRYKGTTVPRFYIFFSHETQVFRTASPFARTVTVPLIPRTTPAPPVPPAPPASRRSPPTPVRHAPARPR